MHQANSLVLIHTYILYGILIIIGYLRDYWDALFPPPDAVYTPKGYAPLYRSFENFYARRLYKRIKDCWNRPISSAPGAWFSVMDRKSDDYNTTFYWQRDEQNNIKEIRALNLSSYNYLGFAESPEHVKHEVFDALEKYGTVSCSTRAEYGMTPIHVALEKKIAEFVGKEDAIVFAMGFATNTTGIPGIIGKGDLIISDSLNHASIILGARSSGASVKVFRHNDVKQLERIIRDSIAYGQPRSRRPWKKVIIIVEGVYSMEGEICKLKEIVELKKKYKCYLYVDEAHSIGALGPNGKGVCDFTGVDPADVDILMGTFTKSFGAVGGYIAGSKKFIEHLRRTSCSTYYGATIAPACAQQILSALKVIDGKDGTSIGKEKIKQLYDNAVFFKKRLTELGFEVVGDDGSPVVCIMLYHPTKMPAFSRECLRRGLAVVVVGAPATDIIGSRVRFCLSAAHTREDMEFALKVIDEVGDWACIKYKKGILPAAKSVKAAA